MYTASLNLSAEPQKVLSVNAQREHTKIESRATVKQIVLFFTESQCVESGANQTASHSRVLKGYPQVPQETLVDDDQVYVVG